MSTINCTVDNEKLQPYRQRMEDRTVSLTERIYRLDVGEKLPLSQADPATVRSIASRLGTEYGRRYRTRALPEPDGFTVWRLA